MIKMYVTTCEICKKPSWVLIKLRGKWVCYDCYKKEVGINDRLR